MVCPAELDQDPGKPPQVPAGAVIEANAQGQAWLKTLTGWGWSLRDLLLDAKTSCQAAVEAQLVKPAGR